MNCVPSKKTYLTEGENKNNNFNGERSNECEDKKEQKLCLRYDIIAKNEFTKLGTASHF
jgi:hypothetical protein